MFQTAKGKGNFGIVSATRKEAEAMGKAWIGKGYKVASDGKTLVSAEGMRQLRPPSFKPRLKKTQAKFVRKSDGRSTNSWQDNAHLDISN